MLENPISDVRHGKQTGTESGVDETVTSKFPGSTVQVGSGASGAGDNREIPVEEGGDVGGDGRFVFGFFFPFLSFFFLFGGLLLLLLFLFSFRSFVDCTFVWGVACCCWRRGRPVEAGKERGKREGLLFERVVF